MKQKDGSEEEWMGAKMGKGGGGTSGGDDGFSNEDKRPQQL